VQPGILHEVGTFIRDIIDFEGTSLEARFIVKRGVDEEVLSFNGILTTKLDNMRNVYDGLQDLLADAARQISSGLEDNLARTMDVMYFPQLVICEKDISLL
jgi:DNA mismatch repair protein MSH5